MLTRLYVHYLNLGLQKLNKLLDALTELNKSIELNDKYTKAYLRRANVHMGLKNFTEAKYDFNKVKELEPCIMLLI